MLDETGYHRPTYDEILNGKIQRAKELFGEDIATDEKTPLGKFIRMNAYDLSKAYEDVEMVYYARFPNTATGISLDRLCVFAGITRNPPTRAQHIIKVFGEEGTTIGMGELVVSSPNVSATTKQEDEITFYSINNYAIPASGSINVTVECTEAGEIGNVDTITEIVNPIAEITGIEYVGISERGEMEESDYNLRKRFSQAIEGSGSCNINAIRAAIMRVTGVVSASVIQNDTDTTVDGRPPRSFECFVYGGEGYDDEIAKAIFDKTPIGINTCSTAEEENQVERTIYDDGGYPHPVIFSRTKDITVYVKMSIKTDARFDSNTNNENNSIIQIKNAITEYINNLGVDTNVILSTLYGYIYSIEGVIEVSSLQLSRDGSAYSAENIIINDFEVATTNASVIDVETGVYVDEDE